MITGTLNFIYVLVYATVMHSISLKYNLYIMELI